MARDLGVEFTEFGEYYFISYNSDDEARIKPLVKKLTEKNIPIWYDKGLVHGEEWKKEISQRISCCRACILFYTTALAQKRDTYVREETMLACGLGKRIIPIFLDNPGPTKKIPRYNRDWCPELIRMHGIDVFNYEKNEDDYIGATIEELVGKLNWDVNSVGKIEFGNGDVYSGTLKDGVMHGNGKYVFNDGSVYRGGFSNGKINGEFGIYEIPGVGCYKGDFFLGVYSGEGTFEWNSGHKYEGSFKRGDLYTGKVYNKKHAVVAEFFKGKKVK